MLKKKYLFLIILVCLFVISTVSAEKVVTGTDNTLYVGDVSVNEEIVVEQDEILSTSIDEEIIAESNKEWYVNSNHSKTGNGSINNPFHNLEFALNKVSDGDIIYIESSIYHGRRNLNLTINKQITIQGLGSNVVFDGGNNSYFFKITASNVTIDNLIFKNGNSTQYGPIQWKGENGFLVNCDFINNTAKNKIFPETIFYSCGGSVYWDGYNGTISNCNFINNFAGTGGAICWANNRGLLKNSSFINNTAESSSGAVYWISDIGNIKNCTFVNNTVSHYGGAISLNGDNVLINNCIFLNNFVNTKSIDIKSITYGGAVYWGGK